MVLSFPLPFGGMKDALQAGLLTAALECLLSAAFPFQMKQWLEIADFVAVYSCEGSGGFQPRFPCAWRASQWVLVNTSGIHRKRSPTLLGAERLYEPDQCSVSFPPF